ncbi:hypothetical protein GOBAR_AA16347 [Gossypium barbadense]|uniref:Uncharacterized protein n=1 Tax=Gossypium barbadense TaxID=3634 RepID=A0A2P5XLT6_GOSBA|nr:hypothetical protein GOBAR_AA16347 [Gossypium barbadense]
MTKGREEVNNNDPKQVSMNHEPYVPYPKTMTKYRTEEQFGDDAVTLQARDSIKTSKTQDNAMKLVDDKSNIQSFLQEPPRIKKMETVRYYHEERRQQIEELDECQLKVGDTVLLDAVDPHIVTTTPNKEIPLTVLSIFPFGTVEVSHPKFGTFKVTNRVFEAQVPRATWLVTQPCLRPCVPTRRETRPCDTAIRKQALAEISPSPLPDPCSQPPLPSRPVHVAASYANISEHLTRFELQCFQQFDNIDATLQQSCLHLPISSPVPPRKPSSDEDV